MCDILILSVCFTKRLNLRQQLFWFADRARNKLREKTNIQRVLGDRRVAIKFLAICLNKKGDLLEGKKRNPPVVASTLATEIEHHQ